MTKRTEVLKVIVREEKEKERVWERESNYYQREIYISMIPVFLGIWEENAGASVNWNPFKSLTLTLPRKLKYKTNKLHNNRKVLLIRIMTTLYI